MAVWRDLDVRTRCGINPTVHFHSNVNYTIVETRVDDALAHLYPNVGILFIPDLRLLYSAARLLYFPRSPESCSAH
jgi:hypothetical protein